MRPQPEVYDYLIRNGRGVFESLFAEQKRKLEGISNSAVAVNPFLSGLFSMPFGPDAGGDAWARGVLAQHVLGPSLTTTFATRMRALIQNAVGMQRSQTRATPIEYLGALGERRAVILLGGPRDLNMSGALDLRDKLEELRSSGVYASEDACRVATLYGERSHLIAAADFDRFEVLAGAEFWISLTGHEDTFSTLIESAIQAANSQNFSLAFENAVDGMLSAPQ